MSINLNNNWFVVKDFPNYEISMNGQVRNIQTKKLLTQSLNNSGYYRLTLVNDTKSYTLQLHRLMAIQFIPNDRNLEFVDHINNNKTDNSIQNLRWCSKQENSFNCGLRSTNNSGVKGVVWDKSRKKWFVTITYNSKTINLGRFNSLEEAKLVRQTKAQELFGDFVNKCEI